MCVNDLAIIGSDNGLSSGRGQSIIWANRGIALTGPLHFFIQEDVFENIVY